MNISEWAFKNRTLILFSLILAMISGAYSYFTLPAREDPEITIREAVITTSFPNMPAKDVERLITRPLEEAVLELPELDEVRSTSLDGMSIIHVKVEDKYKKLAQVWDELAESVSQAGGRLPTGASQPVVNDDFGDVAVLTAAIWSDDFELDELYDIAQYLRNQLIYVKGTRKIELHGAPEEVFYIDFNEAKLAGFGLSKQAVMAAIQQNNVYRGAGQVDNLDYSVMLMTDGGLENTKSLENLAINIPGAEQIVRLGDLAQISKTTKQPYQRAAFFNGKRAIVLSVAMQPEQSVINYTKRLDKAITSLVSTLPAGINFDLISKQSEQVENAIYGVTLNVIQTLIIVLVVVMLFLGVKTGLIVGAIVPGVMMVTLAIMGIFDMQLERMSLATLVIALGLLVDNGIVVAEHFKRRLEAHGERFLALKEVGQELSIPLLSSTATTVVVFIPLMMAEHSAGEFTRNISLVVLISLSVSWLLAMTVTPTLCALFMPKHQIPLSSKATFFERFETLYQGWIATALSHRYKVVVGAILSFFLGVWIVVSVPKQFFPASDRAQLLAYLSTPAGSSTQITEQSVLTLMADLQNQSQYPGVQNVAAYVGYGGPRFILSLTPLDPASNAGFMLIDIDSAEDASSVMQTLRRRVPELLPDSLFRVSTMFTGPSDPSVLQIQVKGPEFSSVYEYSQELIQLFNHYPDTIDVWSNWFNMATRIQIDINQALAAHSGITTEMIIDALNEYVSGRIISVSRQGDEQVPIVLRGQRQKELSPEALSEIRITSPKTGKSIPLEPFITLKYLSGFPRIEKEDGQATVTVEGRNLLLSPEDMAPQMSKALEEINQRLPAGYNVEFDGIISDSQQGKAALSANFPMALAAIVLILIAQFGGLKRPLVVLLSVPLVVFGAGIGLAVVGASFGFIVILGLLALAGIIVNNAIVLIDRIDIERAEPDVSLRDAIIKASTMRLRPILITTVTTIVGLLPLIVAKDVLFFGMASAIAFGLGIGTLLTLFVVPVLYELFLGKQAQQ